MKRTFNYTERREIKKQDVFIQLREEQGGLTFDAELQGLSTYKLPRHAKVWVEAHRQNLWMQFDWGTIAQIRPPSDRKLTEFDVPDGILFRVRVVLPDEPERHKLVAEVDGIHFVKTGETSDQRRPLIVPEPDDLDQLIWKLDLESDPPRLLINKNAKPTWKELARSPYFISFVYPEILRCILTKILIDDNIDEDDEAQNTDWIKFASNLTGSSLPHTEEKEDRKRWIEDAVMAFARRNQIKNNLDLTINRESE